MYMFSTALPFNFSYDGQHYTQNVNLVKAQALLNWLHVLYIHRQQTMVIRIRILIKLLLYIYIHVFVINSMS